MSKDMTGKVELVTGDAPVEKVLAWIIEKPGQWPYFAHSEAMMNQARGHGAVITPYISKVPK